MWCRGTAEDAQEVKSRFTGGSHIWHCYCKERRCPSLIAMQPLTHGKCWRTSASVSHIPPHPQDLYRRGSNVCFSGEWQRTLNDIFMWLRSLIFLCHFSVDRGFLLWTTFFSVQAISLFSHNLFGRGSAVCEEGCYKQDWGRCGRAWGTCRLCFSHRWGSVGPCN